MRDKKEIKAEILVVMAKLLIESEAGFYGWHKKVFNTGEYKLERYKLNEELQKLVKELEENKDE